MQPIKIDLNDYVRTGEGANGASYNHKSDPNIMLKLYFRNFEAAEQELVLARKVYEMGIPTPEPGDLVTDGKQVGIRFRRLMDKKSFSRACGDNPERTDVYAREFAQMCIKLHNTHVDTSRFENVKDRLYAMLETNPDFTPVQKQKIHDYIAAAPDADTAIHGDLQFGNGIFVPSGEKYFIDLGDFCYGFPLFDLGMVYLCCCLNNEEWTMEVNHMSNATARRFWDAFAEAYFHSPDCPLIGYDPSSIVHRPSSVKEPLFGPGADLEQVEQVVKIYAGLKTLIVERDTHCPMPQFRAMLEGTVY
ncbi:MAG: phosphotransferase [Paludibacteraceae bacterium]|nr:phosphotransferase [Paludibacteraceae bacterium]